MAVKLTPYRIEQFRYKKGGPKIQRLWDNQVPGLGIEAYTSGRKAWILRYRLHGRQHIITIGGRELSLESAREAALEALRQVREGTDPKLTRGAPDGAMTVSTLFEHYIASPYFLALSEDYRANFLSNYRCHVAAPLGEYPVVDVRRFQVRKIAEDLQAAGKEGAARRVVKGAQALFAHAVDLELIEHSPCDRLRIRWQGSGKRDRWLKADDELRSVWHVEAPLQVQAMARWLLLTGARRDEARLTKLQNLGETWTVEDTKGGRALVLPMMPLMESVAGDLSLLGPRVWLFPSMNTNSKPLPRGTWDQGARKASGGVWSAHVLRHTVESHLAELGVTEELRDLVLNHARRGTGARIYQHSTQLAMKRDALEAWHGKLLSVLTRE